MTLSVVLRLVPSALLEGRIVGEAEFVETGSRRIVRSIDELVAFINDSSEQGPGSNGSRNGGPGAG